MGLEDFSTEKEAQEYKRNVRLQRVFAILPICFKIMRFVVIPLIIIGLILGTLKSNPNIIDVIISKLEALK